jgi:hypothetical protein
MNMTAWCDPSSTASPFALETKLSGGGEKHKRKDRRVEQMTDQRQRLKNVTIVFMYVMSHMICI